MDDCIMSAKDIQVEDNISQVVSTHPEYDEVDVYNELVQQKRLGCSAPNCLDELIHIIDLIQRTQTVYKTVS